MKTLLDATGKIALPLFITFNDSVELYKLKSRKSNILVSEKEKDQEQITKRPVNIYILLYKDLYVLTVNFRILLIEK